MHIFKTDNIVIKGNSKKNRCRDEMNILIPTSNCSFSQCSIDGVYLPPVHDLVFFVSKNNKQFKLSIYF